MMSTATLGRQVVASRKARKLTQEQLAELAGIHRTTISRIERGSWEASWDTVCRIAKALGVSLDVLAGRDGE